MNLRSVSIKGFRPFKDEVTIPIDDLTVLIGRNDIGKSSILEALGIFLGCDDVKLEANDCNIYGDNKVIEITCEFDDLPSSIVIDSEATTCFQDEYLLTKENTLKIKKRYDLSGAKLKEEVFICAYHPTAPEECKDLLLLTNAQLKDRLRTLKIPADNVDLRSNTFIRKAIWQFYRDLNLDIVEIPVNREDAKRIWEQISKLMPIYALFKSDRPSQDSDSEIQDPMKLAINAALSEVKDDLDRIVEIVKTKALEIASQTHEQLKRIDEKIASDLKPVFKSDPQWGKVFSLGLNTDDGIPLNKRGSGVRRLVLLSFFRAEVERRRKEQTTRSIIYAIEEPETSQHPNNQKLLLDALTDLSQESGCQVLLTTHSPGFANMLPLRSLRYLERFGHSINVITGHDSSDDVYTRITDSLGIVPDTRVKVLICVEGPTDVVALECLSHALHTADTTIPDLSKDSRVAFTVLGGGTLKYWVNEHYLKGLGRPEVHIYDSDSQYRQYCEKLNQRGDESWAVQTKKKEIENYLHPDAIFEGLGIRISFGDMDDVPELIRQQTGWNHTTIKQKLAQYAFPRMTPERIRERDPQGEIEGWLRRITEML